MKTNFNFHFHLFIIIVIIINNLKRSPLGTYLTTIHRQGGMLKSFLFCFVRFNLKMMISVALWGGPSWSRIVRFQHPAVEVVRINIFCLFLKHFYFNF